MRRSHDIPSAARLGITVHRLAACSLQQFLRPAKLPTLAQICVPRLGAFALSTLARIGTTSAYCTDSRCLGRVTSILGSPTAHLGRRDKPGDSHLAGKPSGVRLTCQVCGGCCDSFSRRSCTRRLLLTLTDVACIGDRSAPVRPGDSLLVGVRRTALGQAEIDAACNCCVDRAVQYVGTC